MIEQVAACKQIVSVAVVLTYNIYVIYNFLIVSEKFPTFFL